VFKNVVPETRGKQNRKGAKEGHVSRNPLDGFVVPPVDRNVAPVFRKKVKIRTEICASQGSCGTMAAGAATAEV
jgi:hypothetical protein